MDRDKLKARYDRTRAASYLSERAEDSRWRMEHDAVKAFLEKLEPGAFVLDIPVGTGRFISLYRELGLRATGVDASNDMLNEARALADSIGVDITLREGDIFALEFEDGSFDAVVCMRFLNWVGSNDLVAAVREFTRVSQCHVILGIEQYLSWSVRDLFRSWSSVRQALLQVKRRFYMWRTRSDYVYHRARVVEAALEKCGLAVVSRTRIPRKKDEGIEYNVFLLKKSRMRGSNITSSS